MAISLTGKKNQEVNKVLLLPIASIYSNPCQPRKSFDADSQRDLAGSILANGLLQPITVRKRKQGGYELIAGERRTLAYRALGRECIPAIIEEMSDEQSAILSLIENLQRKDLNYFEEAMAIVRLMEQLGHTQQQIAAQLGRAQSTIANKLRLLRYPPTLQQMMLNASLTERHARALLRLSDEQLADAVTYIIAKGLNVQESERYVEQVLTKKESAVRTRLFVIKDVRLFQNSIHKAIAMMHSAGIDIDQQKTETDEYLEYRIRIPKNSIYKQKPASQMDIG